MTVFVNILILIAIIAVIITAISFKPIRKTLGLLLVILGAIACLSIFGAVIGIPMIIIGGIFLFI